MRQLNKLILLTSIIHCCLCACKTSIKLTETKNKNKLAVKSTKFNGTLFTKSYPFFMFLVSDIDSTRRFTPTKEEIEQAESLLRAQIKEVNISKGTPNQMRPGPIIHKKLYSYFRQYAGFKAANGDRIIHINFFWDKYTLWDRLKGYSDPRILFDDDYTTMFDGDSRY